MPDGMYHQKLPHPQDWDSQTASNSVNKNNFNTFSDNPRFLEMIKGFIERTIRKGLETQVNATTNEPRNVAGLNTNYKRKNETGTIIGGGDGAPE